MTIDTSTPEGMAKRLREFVDGYAERHNWPAVARLIGGSPRYDMQDYQDSDHGEAPKGAQW